MMFVTEEQAKGKNCALTGPVGCLASQCMQWRWRPLIADTAWQEAVKKAAEELGDKSPGRSKAAAHVNANRARYGLPDKPFEGYCGLAGKPEA